MIKHKAIRITHGIKLDVKLDHNLREPVKADSQLMMMTQEVKNSHEGEKIQNTVLHLPEGLQKHLQLYYLCVFFDIIELSRRDR